MNVIAGEVIEYETGHVMEVRDVHTNPQTASAEPGFTPDGPFTGEF